MEHSAHLHVTSSSLMLAHMLCERIRDLHLTEPSNKGEIHDLLKDIAALIYCRARNICDLVALSLSSKGLRRETYCSPIVALLDAVKSATDLLYMYIGLAPAHTHDNKVSILQRLEVRVRLRFQDIQALLHDCYASDQQSLPSTSSADAPALDALHMSLIALRSIKLISDEKRLFVSRAALSRGSSNGQYIHSNGYSNIKVVMSPSRDIYAVLGSSSSVSLRSVSLYEDESDQKTLQGLNNAVSVAFSPKGDRLAAFSGSSSALKLYQVSTGALLHVLEGHKSPLRHFEWSPDGTAIATLDQGGQVVLWESPNPSRSYQSLMIGVEIPICGLVWCLVRRRMALSVVTTAGTRFASMFCEHAPTCDNMYTSDAQSLEYIKQHTTHCVTSPVVCLARPTLSKHMQAQGFAVGCADHKIRLMHGNAVKKGISPFVLHGHKAEIILLEFSPDGRMLVSCSADGNARVWKGQTRHCPERMTCIHVFKEGTESITCVAWSCDSCRVAAGYKDGTVRVWNVATGALDNSFCSGSGAITSLAFARDSLFVSASDVVRAYTVRVGAV